MFVMNSFLVGIFCLLIVTAGSDSHSMIISEEEELQAFLCAGQPLMEDFFVALSTNITHYISSNVSFCMINTTYSLTITSNSSLSAVIDCDDRKLQPNSGFVFTNAHNLTLHRLVLRGCGGYLRGLDLMESINSTGSPVYFTQYQSSVLLFLRINVLLIRNVKISSYYGFAVLTINPMNALMDGIEVTLSKGAQYIARNDHSVGCGAMILFTDDHTPSTIKTHNVIIRKALFYQNYDFVQTIDCLSDLQYFKAPSIPVVNAGGLTIIYSQKTFFANVSVLQANFDTNLGSLAGAMLILYYKSLLQRGSNFISNSKFTSNYNAHYCHGSGLSLFVMPVQSSNKVNSNYTQNTLTIENTSFMKHYDLTASRSVIKTLSIGAGAIYIGVLEPFIENNITAVIKNAQFIQNNILSTGSCIFAETIYRSNNDQFKVLNVVLDNVVAYNNSQSNTNSVLAKVGMFVFHRLRGLYITGLTCIYDNYGIAFDITDTKIVLSGDFYCARNAGEKGPAFSLHGQSYFHFQTGLRATFINNTALTNGGAIHAFDESFKQCTFQTENNMSHLNISIIFINNSASASGSSIFSTNLYYCISSSGILTKTAAENLYKNIFTFIGGTPALNNMSSLSVRRCVCIDNNTRKCDLYEYPINVYPGLTVVLPMVAEDAMGKNVHSVVTIGLGLMKKSKNEMKFLSISSWYVSQSSTEQVLLESQQCTVVSLTLRKRTTDLNLSRATLIVSSPNDPELLKVNLKLVDCPLGFELNVYFGTCNCSSVIGKGVTGYHPICHISEDQVSTISMPIATTYWIGLMNLSDGTTVFGVSASCHAYCNFDTDLNVFVVGNTAIVKIADPTNLSNSIPLCLENKEGPLCSKCAAGYSVTFGSSECKQCSNLWLLTLVGYAAVGPLFIYLLYALNLTLTAGTLNGIIFYAQIYAILSGLSLSSLEHDPLSTFFYLTRGLVSLINFNLHFNYPICLYDGMTHVMKSGLSLVFPMYLLGIVIFLIIVSRYSVRLSNRISGSSVQVLVTVVHLSSSRMFTSIMDVYTPINIYTNATKDPIKVWLNDATTEYGKGSHLILMIVASLIIGPVLSAYMTILLAGRFIQRNKKLREYIRPIYEAIHAPYKRNKEFFFTSHLLITIFFYILYAAYRGNEMYTAFAIGIPSFCLYIAFESLCRPFAKMTLNVFVFIQNGLLVTISCTIWFFMIKDYFKRMAILFIFTNVTIIVCLFGVIALHALWVTGALKKFEYNYFRKMIMHSCSSPKTKKNINFSGSFFEEYNDVREPLLSPTY